MWRKVAATAAVYAAVSLYYRFRAQPDGVDGGKVRTYQVPAENIAFYHDTTWYEQDARHAVRQIVEVVIRLIRKARAFVVMDVFLFNLHHTSGGTFIPTTRQIADAFRGKKHPAFFITDPLNTSYGTAVCEPLNWLRGNGVRVCITHLRKLRDNHLIYSPIWRMLLQWFDTGSYGWLPNPLRKGRATTLRAVLEALNAKGNHRKVLIADEDDGYVTLITSSNFEDASCYFINTAIKIRSHAVARHFLEAEKAVARMSGCPVTIDIPERTETGNARVTPLMGGQIKRALLGDLRAAGAGDRLFVFTLFLADRDVIREIIEAAKRGAAVTVVLDHNKVSFGSEKMGFPNQIVAAELRRRASLEVRWANTQQEEFHLKSVLLVKQNTCIMHSGSANLTRRSLSNTNLEANVRVEAPLGAPLCQEMLAYARWISEEPRSFPGEGDRSILKYGWYRFTEATGFATW